jgi:hypothetical protein
MALGLNRILSVNLTRHLHGRYLSLRGQSGMISRSVYPADVTHNMPERFILDIGGEGRHEEAWNLNPRALRSVGEEIGQPIPRLIRGRGDAIPLRDQCVDVLIVERTPLLLPTLNEMLRVARPNAQAILRHAVTPAGDPHRLATRVLKGAIRQRMTVIGRQQVQETIVTF